MTQRRIRLGVQLKPQHADYGKIRDTVVELEQLGVDVIFNWDHFYPLNGDPEGKHFECWTMLGAWAEQTSRVEFGSLVNSNAYRNPDLQADMARTLDHISGGRFLLGTGSGWAEKDFVEYGYPFGTPGERLNELAEALPRIKARWQKLNPAPTRPIPILVGGGGEKKTMRIAAEHADIWHSYTPPADLPRKLAILAEHAAAVGRDVSEIELSNELAPRSEADADALLVGGVTFYTVGITGPDYDLTKVKSWLAWRDRANG